MRLKFNLKFYVNYEFGKDFLRKLKLHESIVGADGRVAGERSFFAKYIITRHTTLTVNAGTIPDLPMQE